MDEQPLWKAALNWEERRDAEVLEERAALAGSLARAAKADLNVLRARGLKRLQRQRAE